MPLQKIQLKPGLNKENTRYTTEGGWFDSDKVRFRQGNPEKLGGWERISSNTFLGVCRSLWNWVTLGGQNLIGVGTNLKFYIERGGFYYDVTPIRSTVTLSNPFDTISGLPTVTVNDTAHGCVTGDYVTFSGASTVGGLNLNNEYSVTVVDANTYTITASSNASSTVTGGGGASVTAAYQINTGSAIQVPITGWGGGPWGSGPWGVGTVTLFGIRLWSQSNFGEDLVFAYRGGPLLYWDATGSTSTRGVYVSSLTGASDVPTIVNSTIVSDINRFVFAFGCNEIGSADIDAMLVRWSDQEDVAMWTPSATNQAGSLRLSHGSEIVSALQARQELLVWTDTSLYSLQYLGAPDVWGAQILGDNLSIASPNAMVYAANTAFWMGKDKFYVYDGTVRPLPSDLRRYVFNDFNQSQYQQVFAGTNEGFNEVWWFYCSANSTTVDRYVVYNYVENVWYYGTMARTAWLDTALRSYPIAATYTYNLVEQEKGTDDKETATTLPIEAYITSSEFDLDDGQHFVLINRILPDVTFEGSTADSPAIIMTLQPMSNSGSGYNSPLSEGGNSSRTITRTATVPIEQFTGQVFVRIRGRQLAMKVQSTGLGVMWQLGSPRLDMQRDGRRGT
jgi:hypothetical protein